MTVEIREQVVHLSGACPSEDAERLLAHLLANPDATVDWRSCEQAHMAVLQVLLAARRGVAGVNLRASPTPTAPARRAPQRSRAHRAPSALYVRQTGYQ